MIRPINLIPALAKLFRSISDEGRLAVLEALLRRERRVAELVEETGQSQSTVSTHLAVLHSVGLVTRHQEGRQVIYRLADASVEALLQAGEDVVVAASAQEFACVRPCCLEPARST